MQLEPNTLLQGGKYRIVRTLGQGGFGITYEAEQVLLRRKVAVKEFFMKDCCERDDATSRVTVGTGNQRAIVERFRGKFIREAQMIAGMDHPHIVRVLDVFEENGTAYYVMDFLPGGSLADKVKKDGPLSEAKAEEYIRQVADALDYIHRQNTVHLDVKPSNILLNAKGEAILVDFGISKHYDDTGEQTSSTPVGISQGYAPLEQGRSGDVEQFSPSTDIYALGATLFYLVTGMVPPEASIIYEDGFERHRGVSDRIWNLINAAMQPRRKDRIQNIDAFLSYLNYLGKTTIPLSEDDKTVVFARNDSSLQENSASKTGIDSTYVRNKTWLWAILLCIAVAVILAVILLLGNDNDRNTPGISGSINGHEYVDLGLSVKWATCNIGAISPDEYGDCFAWGETKPKMEFSTANYVFYNDYHEEILPPDPSDEEMVVGVTIDVNINKYNDTQEWGDVDNKYHLDLVDDAAFINWGYPWRMPTKDEFDELVKKCSWKWVDQGTKRGFLVTSKQNGQSIFLPAEKDSINGEGSYWTSTRPEGFSTTAQEHTFMFNDYNWGAESLGCERSSGMAIRPVITGEEEESIPFQKVEKKPGFNGGDANEFSKWVNSQLIYPEIAKYNGVQGQVTLRFTVEVDGRVTNVIVLEGIDESLDNEALRVVTSSPKWTPGEHHGRPVRVTYTFPIIFQLQ